MLQLDLAAPGVDILAAWTEAATMTSIDGDKRVIPYNIISGTSMACPHATATAVYVKSFHPTWSPTAIKSTLMTTGNIKFGTNKYQWKQHWLQVTIKGCQ